MHSSKLIKLLKTLSKKETRQFDRYLQSVYFNETDRLVQCLQYLLRYAPKYTSNKLKKEKVFALLFPGQPYDDLEIRHVKSQLYHHLLQFLQITSFQQTTFPSQMQLLKELRSRHQNDAYDRTFKKLQDHTTNLPWSANSYLHRYQMADEYAAFIFQNRSRWGNMDQHLQSTMNSLDEFFLVQKLRYCCVIITRNKVTSIESNILLMDEVIEHLEDSTYLEVPAIAIYYQILMTLLYERDEKHFMNLKLLLKEHAVSFSKSEAFEMYQAAQNYCIRKINEGNEHYLREAFLLYKSLLANGLLLMGGTLSPWDYKNIATSGLKLGQFEWTLDFIQTYIGKIPLDHQENAIKFNMAQYYFFKKEYDKTTEDITLKFDDDPFYGLDFRTMLVKIYYETGEWDKLDNLISSFKTYLTRNEGISKAYKTNYLGFLKQVNNMMSLPVMDGEGKTALQEAIRLNKNLVSKDWLLEKLEEV